MVMPIQEVGEQVSNMAPQSKRSNKPIMEKRRRARINQCLNELKALILDAMKKDPARHSKLEKADILEMTVKHLQTVQRHQLAVAVATDPSVLGKFKAGFGECATEVSRYITRIEGVEPSVRRRLLTHLASCISSLQQLNPLSFTALAAPGLASLMSPETSGSGTATGIPSALPQVPFPAGDVNNNHARVMNSFQLIPGRLATGELAFVLPGGGQTSNQFMPFFPPVNTEASVVVTTASATVTSGTAFGQERATGSAFTAVSKQKDLPSINTEMVSFASKRVSVVTVTDSKPIFSVPAHPKAQKANPSSKSPLDFSMKKEKLISDLSSVGKCEKFSIKASFEDCSGVQDRKNSDFRKPSFRETIKRQGTTQYQEPLKKTKLCFPVVSLSSNEELGEGNARDSMWRPW